MSVFVNCLVFFCGLMFHHRQELTVFPDMSESAEEKKPRDNVPVKLAPVDSFAI
jgi:hypothetical protein